MKFMGHEGVAFVVDDQAQADWYRCACGGSFGRREWHGTCPHEVPPTFEDHVLEAEGLVRHEESRRGTSAA